MQVCRCPTFRAALYTALIPVKGLAQVVQAASRITGDTTRGVEDETVRRRGVMVKEARRLWTPVGRRSRQQGGLLLVSMGALIAGAGALIGVRRWLVNNRTPTETRPPITPPPCIHPLPPDASPTLAVIGDFGRCQKPGVECLNERVVAHLVDSWSPDYVITTGDNNYPDGERSTLIANLDPFRRYIEDGCFLPVLGNHDWKCRDAPLPYIEQFRPPGNGRYYCVVLGELAVWALDSDEQEPDGIDAGSVQAAWLRVGLAQSRSRMNLVFLHHPPYSSGHHGSSPTLRWPFAAWGRTRYSQATSTATSGWRSMASRTSSMGPAARGCAALGVRCLGAGCVMRLIMVRNESC